MPIRLNPFDSRPSSTQGPSEAQESQQKLTIEESRDPSPAPRGLGRLFGSFAAKPEPTRPVVYNEKLEKALLKRLYKHFRSYHARLASSSVRQKLRELHAGGKDVPAVVKAASKLIYAAQDARADVKEDEIRAGTGDYENQYLDGANCLVPPEDYEVVHVLTALAEFTELKKDSFEATIEDLRKALESCSIRPPSPPPSRARRAPPPPPEPKTNPEPTRASGPERTSVPAARLLGTTATSAQLLAALDPNLTKHEQRTLLEIIPEEAWKRLAEAFTFNDVGVVAHRIKCLQVLQACQVDPADKAACDRLVKGLSKAFFAIHPDKNPEEHTDQLTVALGAVQAIRQALQNPASLAERS